MEKLTSTKNAVVKQLKKLHSSKGRKESGQYLLEGEHLYMEAKKANVHIKKMIVTQNFLDRQTERDFITEGEHIYAVTEEVMKVISQTQTSQGIVCVLDIVEKQLPNNFHGKFVLLDEVQDPGNAGTIVRTADAAGFDGVIFGTGSVDVYNDKVVRSMQGSHFHIPLYQNDLNEVIDQYIQKNIPIYGTALNKDACDFREVPVTDFLGLLLGNEGKGISKSFLSKTSQNLYIPILGEAESLNVAVAAGILMYHFL